jgi:hypothetical protein
MYNDKPPTKSMEILFHGCEGTGSGVYNPNFLLLGLLVAHMTHPFIYLEIVSFIRGQ